MQRKKRSRDRSGEGASEGKASAKHENASGAGRQTVWVNEAPTMNPFPLRGKDKKQERGGTVKGSTTTATGRPNPKNQLRGICSAVHKRGGKEEG